LLDGLKLQTEQIYYQQVQLFQLLKIRLIMQFGVNRKNPLVEEFSYMMAPCGSLRLGIYIIMNLGHLVVNKILLLLKFMI
jgi:hypothetical protein